MCDACGNSHWAFRVNIISRSQSHKALIHKISSSSSYGYEGKAKGAQSSLLNVNMKLSSDWFSSVSVANSASMFQCVCQFSLIYMHVNTQQLRIILFRFFWGRFKLTPSDTYLKELLPLEMMISGNIYNYNRIIDFIQISWRGVTLEGSNNN